MDIRVLLEGFDTVVPYQWQVFKKTYCSGRFAIDDVKYQVTIQGDVPLQSEEELRAYDGDESPIVAPGYKWYWNLEFNASVGKRLPQHDNTGTGNQWKVYSTVIAMMREVMQEFGSGPIFMSAADAGRQSLYPRMIKRFLPNWRIEKVSDSGDEFVIYPQ